MISKKTLLAIHGWVGLKLSLLMFIVCFTGTFAVISHELDWLFTSDLRVSAPNNKEINWDAIYANTQKKFPHRLIATINAPLYSNFSSIVITNDPELGVRRVFVNPYTGEVQGDLPYYASFQRTLRDLHRYLLAPLGGIYIVGPLGIFLLISVISALFFYKKWWQGFFKLRIHSGSRAFWGSLHKVAGLWSLWFILLMGLTGTWYLAEKLIRDAGINIQPDRVIVSESILAKNQFFETGINAGNAITTAKQTIQNFEPTSISFLLNQSQPMLVRGYTEAMLVRPRSNAVYINPTTGEVISHRITKDQSALSIWIDAADPLHFGNFDGLAVKIIWFFFGLLLCLMSASGIVIFVKRIQNRKKGSWIHNILGAMKYVTFSLLIIPIVFGTILILYANNKIAYIVHNDQKTLVTQSPEINFPETTLYIAKNEENTILRLGFNCHQCIAKKHITKLVLNNGDIVRFKGGYSGYRGSPSAIIPNEQLSNIKHILLETDTGQTIQLNLSE